MTILTHNDWGQFDIINNIIVLTKRGADTVHTIIPKKYQKYPSTIILKQEFFLARVNNSPYGPLENMSSHYAYSITIHTHTTTLADFGN